ncbi:hypothetical protein [Arthrobacter livingstonensis]|nr:hypothetical protein [Arthrobacter livingstonensis]
MTVPTTMSSACPSGRWKRVPLAWRVVVDDHPAGQLRQLGKRTGLV